MIIDCSYSPIGILFLQNSQLIKNLRIIQFLRVSILDSYSNRQMRRIGTELSTQNATEQRDFKNVQSRSDILRRAALQQPNLLSAQGLMQQIIVAE